METSKTALHFATTAKRVQMKPVVNEVKNDKTVIARMQLEIQELREQLVGAASSLKCLQQARCTHQQASILQQLSMVLSCTGNLAPGSWYGPTLLARSLLV